MHRYLASSQVPGDCQGQLNVLASLVLTGGGGGGGPLCFAAPAVGAELHHLVEGRPAAAGGGEYCLVEPFGGD